MGNRLGNKHVERLMPIAEVAKRIGIPERKVSEAWKSGLQKLGLDGIPTTLLKPIISYWLESKEAKSLIGCGSVECDRHWIDLNGNYFDLESA